MIPSNAFLLTNYFQLIRVRHITILQRHCMNSRLSGLLKWYLAYRYLFTIVRIDEMIM